MPFRGLYRVTAVELWYAMRRELVTKCGYPTGTSGAGGGWDRQRLVRAVPS